VNCASPFFTYPKRCRQLLIFKFLPNALESHAILSKLLDGIDTLLNDIDVFEGRSSPGDKTGPFTSASPRGEDSNTLAAKVVAAQSDIAK